MRYIFLGRDIFITGRDILKSYLLPLLPTLSSLILFGYSILHKLLDKTVDCRIRFRPGQIIVAHEDAEGNLSNEYDRDQQISGWL